MMLKAVIADDEPLARMKIRRLLEEKNDVQVVAECGDGRAAVAAVRATEPDLLFLDIAMPEQDGFEVMRAIQSERMPAVVFVTAHDEYALRAFEVHAADYLLKPFDRRRFDTALEAARGRLRKGDDGELGRRLLRLLQGMNEEPAYLQRLTVRKGRRICFLDLKDVEWIDAAANYVRLSGAFGSTLLRGTMSSLETRLDPRRFLRIHRSTIVNLDHVHEIEPHPHGEYAVVLKRGQRLTLSRTHRDRLARLLGR